MTRLPIDHLLSKRGSSTPVGHATQRPSAHRGRSVGADPTHRVYAVVPDRGQNRDSGELNRDVLPSGRPVAYTLWREQGGPGMVDAADAPDACLTLRGGRRRPPRRAGATSSSRSLAAVARRRASRRRAGPRAPGASPARGGARSSPRQTCEVGTRGDRHARKAQPDGVRLFVALPGGVSRRRARARQDPRRARRRADPPALDDVRLDAARCRTGARSSSRSCSGTRRQRRLRGAHGGRPVDTAVVLALLGIVIVLWVTEVVPALGDGAARPRRARGVAAWATAKAALAPFFHPIIALFFGGFMIAEAMRRVRPRPPRGRLTS